MNVDAAIWTTGFWAEQRGRTIVDSLMNLPLLFWAAEQSTSPHYAQAGQRHAEQLMRCVVRPDGSTFHTYYFDVDSGAAKLGKTHQGQTDKSTWSRGQAWALYGFALAYRYTGDARFSNVAKQLADVFLTHVTHDTVAYWDFDFTDGSNEPKDSSASAIAACGLLELAEGKGEREGPYRQAAKDILHALWTTCTPCNGVDALLLRVSKPDWTPYW